MSRFHDAEVLPGYRDPLYINEMCETLGRISGSYQCVVNMLMQANNERNEARKLAEEWRDWAFDAYSAGCAKDIPPPQPGQKYEGAFEDESALPWEADDETTD